MNSPDVNKLFSCFAGSPSGPMNADTLKAFIFSLKNNKALPPFKCFAQKKNGAIYKSSNFGPSFGTPVSLFIKGRKSRAKIGNPYSAPIGVNNCNGDLTNEAGRFDLDNYEVFYLAKTSSS